MNVDWQEAETEEVAASNSLAHVPSVAGWKSRLLIVRDWVVYISVRICVCVLQAVTMETCQSVSQILAFVCANVLRIRGKLVEENLRGAFPDWDDRQRRIVSRQMWEHLFLMVCEVAHTPRKVHETNWRKYVTVEEKRELVGRLLDRRPTIMVSGHFGNFELASYICALLGFPSYSIARPLDNRFLNDYLNRFRGRTGQFMLPKIGSAPHVQRVLESNGKLALLGDQHAGPKGCWVDFMGRPASCHKGLALFSLRSGGPLLAICASRTSGPMRFAIRLIGTADPNENGPETAGVKPLTQWYNRMLEVVIRRNPEQYWWLHRRWRDPPVRVKPVKKQTESLGTQGLEAHDAQRPAA